MKLLKIIFGKNMDCHREQNIRVVFVLLLTSLFVSCKIGTIDQNDEISVDSIEYNKPLNLHISFTGDSDCPEMCDLYIMGDSLFFYDNGFFVDSCSYAQPVLDRRKQLVKKLKLEDWQVKNLQQLCSAVGSDSKAFITESSIFICDVRCVNFSIDGKPRLFLYQHWLDWPVPPALLTLYLYVYNLSPYDYNKYEWLKYVKDEK